MQVTSITCPLPGKSFAVRDGDVVVIRLPVDSTPEESNTVLKQLVDGLAQLKHARVHIVACSGRYEIEKLDEDAMRSLGWVRPDEVEALVATRIMELASKLTMEASSGVG